MEAHVASVEDHLLDSLQFKLRPGASYATARRSVTFFRKVVTTTNQMASELLKLI